MFAVQIDNGVKWLDERFPDWEWRVNIAVLDLRDCALCVLGQLTGGHDDAFFDYIEANEISYGQCELHGFFIDASWLTERFKYSRLTAEWRTRILELREERKVSRLSNHPTTATLELALAK